MMESNDERKTISKNFLRYCVLAQKIHDYEQEVNNLKGYVPLSKRIDLTSKDFALSRDLCGMREKIEDGHLRSDYGFLVDVLSERLRNINLLYGSGNLRLVG